MHCDLDLWPFHLKIYRAHSWLMGSLHVKFHDDRCKGKAVMRRKPKCGRTDGRTDGQTDMVIPVYPPNFVAGGIITWFTIRTYIWLALWLDHDIWTTFYNSRSLLLLHLKWYKYYGFHTLFRWTRYFVCMTKCDNVTRLWYFPLLENLNIHLAIEKIIIDTKVDKNRPDFISVEICKPFRHEKNAENNRSKIRPTCQF